MAEIKRQIVAMGGGGFSMEHRKPVVRPVHSGSCPERKTTSAFVPTAGVIAILILFSSTLLLGLSPLHAIFLYFNLPADPACGLLC